MAFAVSASAVGRVAFLGANSGLRAPAPSGPRSTGRGGVVTTQAFFNFGGVKQPAGVAMVCRDCGYVYRGMDFNDLPKDYKCPPCGSGKNAFRPEKKADFVKDGFNAPGARGETREPSGVPREARRGEEEGGDGGEEEALRGAFGLRARARRAARGDAPRGEMKRRETRGRDGKRVGRAARDRGSWLREP